MLAPGTYYFEDLEIANNVKVTLSGPVLIYVESGVDIGNNVVINAPGNPADFVLISYDEIDIGTNTVLHGLLYAQDDIELANNVAISGAVTSAEEVDTKQNTSVTYDPDVVNNDLLAGLCGAPGAASLLVDYRFDELLWTGATGEVLDSSGNDYHGTAINNLSTMAVSPAIAGNPGTCRYGNFNGSGQYVEDSNADQYLEGLSAVTVMAWIRNADASSHDRGIFTTGAPNNNDNRFALRYDASGASTGHNRLLKASINTSACNDGSDCLQVETESNLQSDNVWQHVAMTWESGEKIRIFIDGSEVDTFVTSSGRGVHNGTLDGVDFLRIGQGTKSANPSSEWQGNIDEFRIYGQALSAAVISQISDETHPCLAPLAEYRFEGCDWTTGATVIDELGSYPGVVVQGAHTAPGGLYAGGLCNVANLENEGADYNRHISLESNPIVLSDDWTLMMWINFPPDFTQHFQAGGYRYSVVSGGTNDLAWIRQRNSDGYREWGTSSNPSAHREEFPSDLTGWHHLTFVASEGSTDLYVDGAYSNTVNYQQTGTYTRIGTSADDAFIDDNRRQNLDTQLDELKFYANALNAQQIASFYALENNGVRWDGSLLNCVPCGGIDHIRIEHDGTGLTCQSETITIRACADANCDNEYLDEVTVNLTSPASGWSPDPVTFSGGSATVDLSSASAGTVTLDAEATVPTANDTLCINSSGGPACEMVFADVGVLIDGADSDADPESAINVQIAGKPSNVSPPGPALQQRIRVVRTDDQTGACVAGVSNETLDATFQYLVPIADQGLADNTITIAGNTGADLTAAGNGASVELTFDGDGTAPFHFVSADAGRYSLQVDLEIPVVDDDGNPVVDAAGDPTGETIPATDTSNPFVVRPLAIYVDATGNPQAQSDAGDVFKRAGENFPLTFKSLRWTAGRDGDNDGLWDLCGDTSLTDPGNYARVSAWIIGQPAADLALPAGGFNPDVSYGDGNVAFVVGENEVTANNVSYSEVGIVQLQADGMNAFFGENVQICSPYIGRFIPDRFTVADNTPQFEHSCDIFTYIGQEFGFLDNPILTVTARGVGGNVVENYGGSFWKYPGDLIGRNYSHAGSEAVTVTLTTAGTENLSGNNDYDGIGTVEISDERLTYQKPTTAIEPFDTLVNLNLTIADLTDNDGVCYDADDDGTCQGYTISHIGGTQQRFGRMVLDNAYGPETMDLIIPARTEYFNGSVFVPNSDDNCTPYTSNYGLLDNYIAPLSAGDTIVSGAGTLVDGFGSNLSLSAPGEGNDGGLLFEYDLDAAGFSWLQFDWNNDGTQTNPTAKATFGIFKGNPRLIYMRESVW